MYSSYVCIYTKTHQNAPHVNFCTFVTIGFQHSYYVRTEPKDVARVENKTYVCTTEKSDTVPNTAPGVKSTLGNWMAPKEMDRDLDVKFDGCMQGGSFINYGLYHAVIRSYMFVISQSTCILSFLPASILTGSCFFPPHNSSYLCMFVSHFSIRWLQYTLYILACVQ